MTNLDSIFKSRDITLLTKICIVKSVVFPVVMYGCESWTMKKAECRRTDALNCGAGEDSWASLGLHGDPASQSTLNIYWKDWCWSWSSNTLATWFKELTYWKDPDAGREWGQEKKGTTEDEIVGWHCWRRNETPTLQSGLNLYILTLASYSCFILYPKYDVVKLLHSICQQIWKTQQWPEDWKRSVFIPIPKKGNAKNAQTTTQLHSSHTLVK